MGHKQQNGTACCANNLPSLFSLHNPILFGEGEWISEDSHGGFEGSSVLAFVCDSLVGAPLLVLENNKSVATAELWKGCGGRGSL